MSKTGKKGTRPDLQVIKGGVQHCKTEPLSDRDKIIQERKKTLREREFYRRLGVFSHRGCYLLPFVDWYLQVQDRTFVRPENLPLDFLSLCMGLLTGAMLKKYKMTKNGGE
ncbi:MAG: hypothetical protein WCJ19_02285 [bacterium]